MRDYKKFYTPVPIANFMAYLLSPLPTDHIIDPHAGIGNLLQAVKKFSPATRTTAVENNAKEYGHNHYADFGFMMDFLEFKPDIKFDGCIANPPFGNDIVLDDHIRKICSIVKPNGRIVMILPLEHRIGFKEGDYMWIPNWARNSDGSETMIKIVNFLNPIE